MPHQCHLKITDNLTLKRQKIIVLTEVEHVRVADDSDGRVVALFLVPVGEFVVVLEHFRDGFYVGRVKRVL